MHPFVFAAASKGQELIRNVVTVRGWTDDFSIFSTKYISTWNKTWKTGDDDDTADDTALEGTDRPESLFGLAGNDLLMGSGADDKLYGGS